MPWSQTTPMHQRTLFIADHLRGIALGDRTVHRVRHLAQDGLQVDRSLHSARPGGPGGSFATSADGRPMPPRPQVVNGADRAAASASDLGCEEAARDPAPATSGLGAAGPLDRLRDPASATAWCRRKTPPARDRASGQARLADPGPQPHLVRGLQRPVPTWATASYCYPLTVTDGYSRFLLGCQGLHQHRGRRTQSRCSRGCSRNTACRSSFAPTTACPSPPTPWRDSRASRPGGCAWACCPQLIEPGKPQQNGRHERMHRTLKAETTRPPAALAARAAAQVRSLPPGVQPRAAARGARPAEPRPRIYQPRRGPCPSKLPAAGVPGSLRSALRQRQWRHPLEQRLGQCLDHLHRRVRRPGRDRRWDLERVLRRAATGPTA